MPGLCVITADCACCNICCRRPDADAAAQDAAAQGAPVQDDVLAAVQPVGPQAAAGALGQRRSSRTTAGIHTRDTSDAVEEVGVESTDC